MKRIIPFFLLLIFVSAGMADESLTVQNLRGERYPISQPMKIYASACSVLAQQFGQAVRPQIVLVLGADTNTANSGTGEVRLTRWNAGLFAQGVVLLGMHELMNTQKMISFAQRALNWANTTVAVEDLSR